METTSPPESFDSFEYAHETHAAAALHHAKEIPNIPRYWKDRPCEPESFAHLQQAEYPDKGSVPHVCMFPHHQYLE